MSDSKRNGSDKPLSLVWLRRDLRLHDHAAFAEAFSEHEAVQPFFIFDRNILARFTRKDDPRLTFLADSLTQLDKEITARGGELLVFYGDPPVIVPKLCACLSAARLIFAKDHEPATRQRDAEVMARISPTKAVTVQDSWLRYADEILKADGTPYSLFSPYFKLWRKELDKASQEKKIPRRDFAAKPAQAALRAWGLEPIDVKKGSATLLEQIGYRKAVSNPWNTGEAAERLRRFIERPLAEYPDWRNMVDEDSTSALSPYIRHGLISIRECVRAAMGHPGAERWLSEIAWRDYYAAILYHFPFVVEEEFSSRYRYALAWSPDESPFRAWQEGMTGYPFVDAAMRQLKIEGWIHNRGRLVAASFLCRHLAIDWRKGEEHFAQYLMDYELSSNNGNWQWCASVGAEAQPYFRVFNPTAQALKFDPSGGYVRKYVPELAHLDAKAIHEPWLHSGAKGYPAPIVEHVAAREHAIAMFKKARG